MANEKKSPNAIYPVPPTPRHPPGWRRKRRMLRKSIRQKIVRNLAPERGLAHTLFRLAILTLIPITIFIMGFVAVTGFVEATQERFGKDALSLQDLLPGDSLRALKAASASVALM